MGDGNGVSRGDRNRNAKLARLRELVPVSNAIVGIDLADNTGREVSTPFLRVHGAPRRDR